MTQANILEMAKQGNPSAIATLLNRQLQPKGISAKAQLNNGCLEIMLEASQVPSQDAVVNFIRRGIDNLQIESIEKVIIYGRETGQNQPAWKDQFHLKEPTTLGDFIIPTAIPEPVNRNSDNLEEIEESNSDNYPYSMPEPEEYDISMIPEEEFIPENSQLGKKPNPLSGIINGIVAAPLILKIGVFAVMAAGGGLLLWKMQQSDNVADTPVVVQPVNNKITPQTPEKPAETPKAQTPPTAKETPKAQTPEKPTETAKAQTSPNPKSTPTSTPTNKAVINPKSTAKPNPSSTPEENETELATNPKPAMGISILQQGVNEAEKSASLMVAARTKDQWNEVSSSWKNAIDLMGQVPKNHPRYAIAQSKIQEYRKYMKYAKSQANQTTN